MKRRRVVVTGLGVVAPNGIGKDEFWKALLAGKSGIRKLFFHGGDPPCHVAGEVNHFDATQYLNPSKPNLAKRMSRVSRFGVACAKMALIDSGLDLTKLDRLRIGICFGTTTGKPDFYQEQMDYLAKGIDSLQSVAWHEFPPHAPTSHIAAELGITGPSLTCSAGCSTGLMVINWGADLITRNTVDIVLVGGADSLVSPLLLACLSGGHLLTKERDPSKASRPYDLRRDGLVPSEAAGVVVLESLESALDRAAHIYAEYVGYSSGADETEMGQRTPNGRGLAAAITAALRNANLTPNQIDCINSHGLSHPIFDLAETIGFKSALENTAYQIPVTSIKSTTGASFSADGMLQTISSCMILEDGLIPPILNLDTPDPLCDLDYVTNKWRAARVNHILTNTRAIGGTNAVLILGRLEV